MRQIKSIIATLMVLALWLVSSESNAQQDPQYTHYMYNMNIVNPAYAGSQEAMTVNFLGRSQWIGIQGAPKQ